MLAVSIYTYVHIL